MTLKRKILTGYGVAVALMGLTTAWAITNLVSLGEASDAILRENYRSILAAENMVDILERQDSGILLLLLGDGENGITQFRENEATFLEWLAKARDNITVPGEADMVRSIETHYMKFRRIFSSLTDTHGAVPSSLAAGSALYRESVHPVFATIRESCIQLRHLNEETMYAASAETGQMARRAIWSTVVVTATVLVLILVFSLFLTKRIITEKTRSDAILSSIDDGLVVFGTDLRMTAVNPAARRLLDVADAASPEPGAVKPLECADIPLADPLRDLIRRTMETGSAPDIPDENRIISFSGETGPRHYLFSATAIRGKDRKISGAVLLLRDVTRLREVERLKNEFVMAASHELRTPLTSLGMSVDLLMEHAWAGLSEKDRDLLKAAQEEVHRMKALVSDLLDLSRIEAGRIELELETVPVQTLIDHARAVFRNQLDMKRIHLTSELIGESLVVRADANKVTWVLTNLISNALRYVSEDGHVRLVAREAGPHIHLSVQDDGPGIPLEYQSRIFQKFVQVKGREPGGSGLGLAICREIVRAHGGTIWAESVPGQGSTFIFTLPVAH